MLCRHSCISYRRFHVVGNNLLQDFKILDLTRILAGPFATQCLADMGAEVIKIEHHISGDDTRTWGPPFCDKGEESAYFLSINRNKKSVGVNLKAKEGVDIIKRLAAKCDVVVENFVPGKLKSLGLGYEDLKKVNDQLIYCSLTGYGHSGPYQNRLAYDVIVSGIGGLIGITGSKEEPAKVGVAISDVCAGLYAHGAILAALLARGKTNKGTFIDVCLLDTQIATLVNVASSYLISGNVPERQGTAHISIVPYQAFKASDQFFIAGALNDGQFQRLCSVLGIPEIGGDPMYKTNPLRVKNRETLLTILQREFEKKTVDEWVCLLEKHNVPAGPINDLKQVFEDEQVIARGMKQRIHHRTAGDIDLVSPPVRFDGKQCEIRSAPPILFEHTDQVLQKELGMSVKEIEDLRKVHAIN